MQLKDLGNLTNAINIFVKTGSLAGHVNDVLSVSFKELSAAQILAKISTLELTDAQKLKIIQQYATDAANYSSIASIQVLSASQKGATASTVGLGTAIKGLGVKLKSLAAAHPILLAITAGAMAIGATYKIWDALTVSLEEAKEQLEETASEFKDAKSEVESVNNELKTTRSRIEELSTKEKLTFVEKSELERLQAVTRELQLQNDALTKKQELKATELGESAIQAYNKEFGDFSDLKQWASTDNLVGLTSLDDPAQMVASLAKLHDELAQELTSGNTEMQAALSMTIETLSGNLLDKLTTLSDYKQNLLSIMDYRELNQAEQSMFDSITEWQREIYSVVDPNKWNQIAFDDIFNTPGIEKTKEELVSLVESGDFDETIADCKVLTEALSNAGFIIDEDTTATQLFKSELKALIQEGEALSDVMESGINFSDILSSLPMNKLEEYISMLNSGEIDEKTIGNFQDLANAMEETGLNAEDAVKAMKEFSDGFTLSSDLISSMNDTQEVISKVKTELRDTKKISVDSLASIAKQFPELENGIAQYNQGLISSKELLSLIQTAYESDAEAYRSAMVYKLSGNEDFFNTIKTNNEQLFTDLASAYGLDVSNWKSLAAAKASIDQQLIHNLSSAWSKYYGVVIDSATGLAKITGNTPRHGSSQGVSFGDPEQSAAYAAALDAVSKANALKKKLDDAANIQINIPGFSGVKTSDSKSGGASKQFSEELNYIDRLLDLSERRLDAYNGELEDALTVNEKNLALDKLVTETEFQLAQMLKVYDFYSQKAQAVLAQIPESMRDQVKNGAIDITTLNDQNLSNLVSQYYELDDAANNAKDQMRELNNSINDLKKQKIQIQIDDLNRTVSKLERLQDKYSSVISAVTSSIQSEMDDVNDYYDRQTEKIQDQIDALNDQNDALEMQRKLEKALYDLRRAENQRTTRIYREGKGFVYEADQEAIRNAQDNYDSAIFEKTKYDLEQILDRLESERDSEIEYLQKIYDSWNDIADSFERMADAQIAESMFGGSWFEDILSGDTDIFDELSENFGNVYNGIFNSEQAIKSFEDLIDCIEYGEISADTALSLMGNQMSNLTTVTVAESGNMANSIMTVPNAFTSAMTMNTATYEAWTASFQEFSNQYVAIANNMAASIESAAERARRAMESITSMDDSSDSSSGSKRSSSNRVEKGPGVNLGYALGTKNAKPGLHKVAEGDKKEIIIQNDGQAIVANQETLYPFNGGEVVLNSSDTDSVLSGKNLTSFTQTSANWPKIYDNIRELNRKSGLYEKMAPSFNIPTFEPKSEVNSTSVQIGDIHLHEVQTVDEFAKAFKKQFPTFILQDLHR